MDQEEKLIADIKKLLGDEPQEDDPYEKGFADKLYEDEDDTPEDYGTKNEPVIRAYNADYRRPSPRSREPHLREEATQRYAPVDEPRPQRTPEQRPVKQHIDLTDEPVEVLPDVPKKKKKHGKGFLKFLLVVVLILALLTWVLFLIAKQPTDENCDLARKKGSSTILLAGTDASGDRTDTLMLLNVNRKSGKISLMSIPRDTKVNSTYTPHKINGAYIANGKGEEGMDALLEYVSECIGFRPDGYMLIDLNVFVELVDLMGGVRFNVPCDMYYNDPTQDLYINLTAGEQTLDGEQAMGLVRFRSGYSMADLQRVNVQRDFLSAAMHQWLGVKNWFRLPKAMKLLLDNTFTDLSMENLLWLGESVLLCGTGDMQMMTIPNSLTDGGEYVIVNGDELLPIINESFNPYEKAVTWDDLYIAY